MHNRLHLFLLSLVFAAGSGACLQKLDQEATSGSTPADFGSVPTPPDGGIPTVLDPNYPVRYGDNGTTTDDPCVATTAQSVEIRQKYCGGCHGPDGTQGQPLFNFVLDDQKLTTTTDMASKMLFVAAGDPDHSRVYQRALLGTMPPIQVSVDQPDYPRPTVSDISVLCQWIICLNGSKPVSGGGAGGNSGGADSGSPANADSGNSNDSGAAPSDSDAGAGTSADAIDGASGQTGGSAGSSNDGGSDRRRRN